MSLAVPPPVKLLTEAEFIQQYDGEPFELLDGVPTPTYVLTENGYMPGGRDHGRLCYKICRLVGDHAETHNLGEVFTNDTLIRISSDPPRMRGGDVAFASHARIAQMPTDDNALTAPDLVVEVRSPNDRPGMVADKVGEYLASGTLMVVVIDPPLHAATVHCPGELPVTLHNGDVLDLSPVLPGFAVPLARLFG